MSPDARSTGYLIGVPARLVVDLRRTAGRCALGLFTVGVIGALGVELWIRRVSR